MQWFIELCKCSPLVNFLNSESLNSRIIEEERNAEEQEPLSIYATIRQKAYRHFSFQDKQQERVDRLKNESSHSIGQNLHSLQNNMQREPNWYDSSLQLSVTTSLKMQILERYLKVSEQYSKAFNDPLIYTGQEIYKGKSITTYLFEYNLPCKLEQAKSFYYKGKMGFTSFKANTQSRSVGGVNINLTLCDKFMVVNPHFFLTASASKDRDNQDGFIVIAYSIISNSDQVIKDMLSKVDLSNHSNGWLHLAGMGMVEEGGNTKITVYLNCQLNITINSKMLKQPFIKQIKEYVAAVTQGFKEQKKPLI